MAGRLHRDHVEEPRRPCGRRVVDRALTYCDERAAAFDSSNGRSGPRRRPWLEHTRGRRETFKFVDPEGLRSEAAQDLGVPMREYNSRSSPATHGPRSGASRTAGVVVRDRSRAGVAVGLHRAGVDGSRQPARVRRRRWDGLPRSRHALYVTRRGNAPRFRSRSRPELPLGADRSALTIDVASCETTGHSALVPSVRHLTDGQATQALRRGRAVEQFVEFEELPDGRLAVRWLTISPVAGGFKVLVHRVEDVGGDAPWDPTEYPPLDDEEYTGEGRRLAVLQDAESALALATGHGARANSWVNSGLVGEEYIDARRMRP